MSLLFNILSRLVIAFLPRSKLLISRLQLPCFEMYENWSRDRTGLMVMGRDSDLHCEGWGRGPGGREEEQQQLKCSDQPLVVPCGRVHQGIGLFGWGMGVRGYLRGHCCYGSKGIKTRLQKGPSTEEECPKYLRRDLDRLKLLWGRDVERMTLAKTGSQGVFTTHQPCLWATVIRSFPPISAPSFSLHHIPAPTWGDNLC